MKLGVLGDVHGNIEALKAAYDSAMTKKVDKIYHLGDLRRLRAVRERSRGRYDRA
jgi:predicted phosphodiesterase